MSPPVPLNEFERLAALEQYDIVNAEVEPGLDRLVALGARLFNVPHCFVSLVDKETQWFKSCFGEVGVREISREVAFCAYTILKDEVLIVEDATYDPRFSDNPLVTGPPGVRFYAGAPLTLPSGLILGSFCLVDMIPREFSRKDATMLADFAALAVDTIEARLVNRRLQEEMTARDVTERALREAESRFQRIVANSPGMVYRLVWPDEGSPRFSFVSDGCRDIFGMTPQSFYNEPQLAWGMIEDEDLAAARSSLGHAVKRLLPWHWSGRLRMPDGQTRWIEGVARAEEFAPGETVMDGILVDVTERKLAELKSESSHRLLQTIINGTDDAVFIKDQDGRYLLINPAGARFLGRKPEEIIGLDDHVLFSSGTAQSTMESDALVFSSGRSHTYEDSGTINGVERTFLSTKNPHRNEAGEIVGIIGIARDITERKAATAALQTAKEEAEKANRAKSDFLSRMSHELRTPLNAILGFGQLLEMSRLAARDQEGVSHILEGGRHLLGLIDEVLEIARIEAGKMRLSLEPVNVSDVVEECGSLTRRMAAERGITLSWECGPEDCVWADKQRIKQVILNLLSNAIKYNRPDGSVTLSCHVAPHTEQCMSALRIEVRDSGLGLTPGEIDRLFVPFERLSAENGSTEGTGLGLALSKGLVQAMGGRIGANSMPGEGSCFWLELPLAQPVAEPILSDDAERDALDCVATGSVLYVEDNASNLRLIECVLDRFPGIKLHSATQGSLGLEMALSCHPDLILLDLHLPDIPGWEVLRRLKADARTANIPVAVISADATAGQIERLKEGGAFDYLTKPLEMTRFLRILEDAFGDSPLGVAAQNSR